MRGGAGGRRLPVLAALALAAQAVLVEPPCSWHGRYRPRRRRRWWRQELHSRTLLAVLVPPGRSSSSTPRQRPGPRPSPGQAPLPRPAPRSTRASPAGRSPSPGTTWLRRFARWRHQVPWGPQIQTVTGTATLAGTGTMVRGRRAAQPHGSQPVGELLRAGNHVHLDHVRTAVLRGPAQPGLLGRPRLRRSHPGELAVHYRILDAEPADHQRPRRRRG